MFQSLHNRKLTALLRVKLITVSTILADASTSELASYENVTSILVSRCSFETSLFKVRVFNSTDITREREDLLFLLRLFR
jgi:hypothetical protein